MVAGHLRLAVAPHEFRRVRGTVVRVEQVQRGIGCQRVVLVDDRAVAPRGEDVGAAQMRCEIPLAFVVLDPDVPATAAALPRTARRIQIAEVFPAAGVAAPQQHREDTRGSAAPARRAGSAARRLPLVRPLGDRHDPSDPIRWLTDRAELTDLFSTYVRTIDSRDWLALQRMYTADGLMEHGPVTVGHDGIPELCARIQTGVDVSHHVIGPRRSRSTATPHACAHTISPPTPPPSARSSARPAAGTTAPSGGSRPGGGSPTSAPAAAGAAAPRWANSPERGRISVARRSAHWMGRATPSHLGLLVGSAAGAGPVAGATQRGGEIWA